jgi:hypothetical protein
LAVILKLRFTFTELAILGTLGVERVLGDVAAAVWLVVGDEAVGDDEPLVEPLLLELPAGVVLAVVGTAAGVTHFDWFVDVVTVPLWHLTCLVAASCAT